MERQSSRSRTLLVDGGVVSGHQVSEVDEALNNDAAAGMHVGWQLAGDRASILSSVYS